MNKAQWEMLTSGFKKGQSWADMCDEEDELELLTVDAKTESVEFVKQVEPIKSDEWTTVKKVVRKRKPKQMVVQKKKCYFHSIGKCHFGNKCRNSHD